MKLGDADYLRRDFPSAFRFYSVACDAGDGFACAHMGFMHERGRGMVVNFAEARRLAMRACDLKEGLGCNNLGWLYHDGLGVPVDRPREAALYRQACELGSPIGCRNLGSMMAKGTAVPSDRPRAFELLTGACDGGDGEACFRLGEILAAAPDGDPKRAAAVYEHGCNGHNEIRATCHACASFSPDACCRLARLQRAHAAEWNVAAKETERLMMRACQAGITSACEELQSSPSHDGLKL